MFCFARFSIKGRRGFGPRFLVILLLGCLWLDVFSQDLEIIIPDLTVGSQRFASGGCMIVPVYVKNNSGGTITLNGFSLQLKVEDPDSAINGSVDQPMMVINITETANTFLADPFSSLNSIRGELASCNTGSHHVIESQLPNGFPTATPMFLGGFSFSSVFENGGGVHSGLWASDSGFDIEDGGVRLIGAFQIPIDSSNLSSVATISIIPDPSNLAGNNYDTGGSGIFTFSNGAEPNGTGTINICPGVDLLVDGQATNTSQSLCVGTSTTLSIDPVGEAPSAYQWYKDDVLLSGETSSNLILLGNQNDGGVYRCEVATSCGSFFSNTHEVELIFPVSIDTQPQSLVFCSVISFELDVVASGTGPLSYQWYKDGVAIGGATSDFLRVWNPTQTSEGIYTCEVTNQCGSVQTQAAIVEYNDIDIIGQPQSIQKCVGESAFLSVTAQSPTSLTYQWYKDGVEVAGATQASLNFSELNLDDNGTYQCLISNACDPVLSDAVVVDVEGVPIIQDQSFSGYECEGRWFRLRVTHNELNDPVIVWKKDGVPLGETSNQLFVDPTTANDAGTYTCEITTRCGSVSSDPFEISIHSARIAQQPQDQVICRDGLATFEVVFEGDVQSYQWYERVSGSTTAYADVELPSETSSTLTIEPSTNMDHIGFLCDIITTHCSLFTTDVVTVVGVTPFSVNVTPKSHALGLDPVTFQAQAECGDEPFSYEWFNEDEVVLSTESSLTISEDLTHTSTFEVSVADSNLPPRLSTTTVLVLVSDNPSLLDPNGDGKNTPDDLLFVLEDWASGNASFDANGDGKMSILDLLFVNTGN